MRVGRTKTRLHSVLSERDQDLQSHPALYDNPTEADARIDGKVATHAAIAAAHHTPGILNAAIGNFTRDAAGDQVISGLGFEPTVVIFFCYGEGGTHQIQSSGFDDSVTRKCVYFRGDVVDVAETSTNSICAFKDASNRILGFISAKGADGFTVTWTLTGTMTAFVSYLAIK